MAIKVQLIFLIVFFLKIVLSSYPLSISEEETGRCNCSLRTNYYKFILSEVQVAPDNYIQTAKLINGTYPGPLVEVSPNEYLVVQVVNNLPTPVSIHWHGFSQHNSISADGVSFVTQYPIPVNGTYIYSMRVGTDPGTHMYHAHTNMDILWIHGPLIVKDDPAVYSTFPAEYQYDDERLIFLEEIFHIPVDLIYDINVNGLPGSQRTLCSSIAINGASYGIWPDSNANSSGYSVINVESGLTYRFRIVCASSEIMFRFTIPNHTFRVIEMDGIYIKPVETDHVDIHTGQRYSVLVTMNQPVDNYIMRAIQVPGPGPPNGLAILHYNGASDPSPLRKIFPADPTDQVPLDMWIVPELYPDSTLNQLTLYPIPKQIDRSILINFEQVIDIQTGSQVNLINGNAFVRPQVPYLFQARAGINITQEPQVFEILTGQNIQIVFQNWNNGLSGCEAHPWHFHGQSIFVVGNGPDLFDESTSAQLINENIEIGKVQFRDTFIQYPLQTVVNESFGSPCGWYAVRFYTKNPGVWAVHCHITIHMITGKIFTFWEHDIDNPTLLNQF